MLRAERIWRARGDSVVTVVVPRWVTNALIAAVWCLEGIV